MTMKENIYNEILITLSYSIKF